MKPDTHVKEMVAIARAVATPLFYREMIGRAVRLALFAAIGVMLGCVLLLAGGLFAYLALHGVGNEHTGLLIASVLAVVGAFCAGGSAYFIGRLNPSPPLKKILDAFIEGWNS